MSGGPPPWATVMCRLNTRSVTRGPLTSAWNLSLNQPVSRRTSMRPAMSARQQTVVAELGPARLVEVFGDQPRLRDGRAALLDHHRGGAGRIDGEELVAALPRPLLDQSGIDPVFAEGDADKS